MSVSGPSFETEMVPPRKMTTHMAIQYDCNENSPDENMSPMETRRYVKSSSVNRISNRNVGIIIFQGLEVCKVHPQPNRTY